MLLKSIWDPPTSHLYTTIDYKIKKSKVLGVEIVRLNTHPNEINRRIKSKHGSGHHYPKTF
jgi:hypothetical protein